MFSFGLPNLVVLTLSLALKIAIKIFPAQHYAVLVFKHSDWLNILAQPRLVLHNFLLKVLSGIVSTLLLKPQDK